MPAVIVHPTFRDAVSASRPLSAHTEPAVARRLLRWSTLSDAIRVGSFIPADDFCFVRDRTEAPADDYSRFVQSDRPELQRELIPDRVQALLRQGYTLRIKNIHRRVPALRDVGQLIESVVNEPVGCNLYAVHDDRPAFGIHADPHDVVVVQLEGTKRWIIYTPDAGGDLDPRRTNRDRVAPVFDAVAPELDIELTPGDVLYLPRSWWHVAVAVGGASLHVTYAVRRPTGLDLALRVLERIGHRDPWRSPLPRSGTVEDRVNYAAQLCAAFAEELTAESIATHIAERDTFAVPRFVVDLEPEDRAAPPSTAGFGDRWTMIANRPLVCTDRGSTIEVQANGRSIALPAFVQPILDQLTRSGTFSQLDIAIEDRPFAALVFDRLQQLGVITRDHADNVQPIDGGG